MSRTDNKPKQKRKRRSFWEPESASVKTWLDNQTDLGVSLQLIIVDVIQKYGDGDVIRAYLAQREQSIDEPVIKPVRPPAQHVERENVHDFTQNEQLEQGNHRQQTEPMTHVQAPVSVVRAADAVDVQTGHVGQAITQQPTHEAPIVPIVQTGPQITPEQTNTQPYVQQESHTEYNHSELMPGGDEQQQAPADEYDPIEIMMADADSRLK